MTRHQIWTFLSDLTGAGTRNLSSILLYMFGLLVTGIVISSVFAVLLLVGDSIWWLIGYITVGVLLLLVVALLGSVVVERLRRGQTLTPTEQQSFTPCRGLVLLVSDGPGKLDEPTLQQHARGGALRYAWLICTPQSEAHANDLIRTFERPGTIDLYPMKVLDSVTLRSTFYQVRAAIDTALGLGLNASDLLVDVTGGTKIMSIGAALACTERRIAIEYVDRIDPRTGKWRPETEAPRFIHVSLDDVRERPDPGDEGSPAAAPSGS